MSRNTILMLAALLAAGTMVLDSSALSARGPGGRFWGHPHAMGPSWSHPRRTDGGSHGGCGGGGDGSRGYDDSGGYSRASDDGYG
jgi:hypothetical protein